VSSGPVHYVRAEQAQLQAEQAYSDGSTERGERLQRDALIHGLLAVAAATAWQGYVGPVDRDVEQAWREVTS